MTSTVLNNKFLKLTPYVRLHRRTTFGATNALLSMCFVIMKGTAVMWRQTAWRFEGKPSTSPNSAGFLLHTEHGGSIKSAVTSGQAEDKHVVCSGGLMTSDCTCSHLSFTRNRHVPEWQDSLVLNTVCIRRCSVEWSQDCTELFKPISDGTLHLE
jgi:hypothetical protein